MDAGFSFWGGDHFVFGNNGLFLRLVCIHLCIIGDRVGLKTHQFPMTILTSDLS